MSATGTRDVTDRVERADRSTLAGGALLVLAGLLLLAVSLDVVWVALGDPQHLLPRTVPRVLADVALLAGAVVLAGALRGSRSVVGPSRIARAGLVLFGAGPLLFRATDLLPVTAADGPSPVLLGVGLLLALLPAAGLVVAAFAAVRTGVLPGVARWSLVALAAWHALFTGVQWVPSMDVAVALTIWWVPLVEPVLLVTTGAAVALAGRGAALRARWRVLEQRW